jgi:hypothetical protein
MGVRNFGKAGLLDSKAFHSMYNKAELSTSNLQVASFDTGEPGKKQSLLFATVDPERVEKSMRVVLDKLAAELFDLHILKSIAAGSTSEKITVLFDSIQTQMEERGITYNVEDTEKFYCAMQYACRLFIGTCKQIFAMCTQECHSTSVNSTTFYVDTETGKKYTLGLVLGSGEQFAPEIVHQLFISIDPFKHTAHFYEHATSEALMYEYELLANMKIEECKEKFIQTVLTFGTREVVSKDAIKEYPPFVGVFNVDTTTLDRFKAWFKHPPTDFSNPPFATSLVSNLGMPANCVFDTISVQCVKKNTTRHMKSTEFRIMYQEEVQDGKDENGDEVSKTIYYERRFPKTDDDSHFRKRLEYGACSILECNFNLSNSAIQEVQIPCVLRFPFSTECEEKEPGSWHLGDYVKNEQGLLRWLDKLKLKWVLDQKFWNSVATEEFDRVNIDDLDRVDELQKGAITFSKSFMSKFPKPFTEANHPNFKPLFARQTLGIDMFMEMFSKHKEFLKDNDSTSLSAVHAGSCSIRAMCVAEILEPGMKIDISNEIWEKAVDIKGRVYEYQTYIETAARFITAKLAAFIQLRAHSMWAAIDANTRKEIIEKILDFDSRDAMEMIKRRLNAISQTVYNRLENFKKDETMLNDCVASVAHDTVYTFLGIHAKKTAEMLYELSIWNAEKESKEMGTLIECLSLAEDTLENFMGNSDDPGSAMGFPGETIQAFQCWKTALEAFVVFWNECKLRNLEMDEDENEREREEGRVDEYFAYHDAGDTDSEFSKAPGAVVHDLEILKQPKSTSRAIALLESGLLVHIGKMSMNMLNAALTYGVFECTENDAFLEEGYIPSVSMNMRTAFAELCTGKKPNGLFMHPNSKLCIHLLFHSSAAVETNHVIQVKIKVWAESGPARHTKKKLPYVYPTVLQCRVRSNCFGPVDSLNSESETSALADSKEKFEFYSNPEQEGEEDVYLNSLKIVCHTRGSGIRKTQSFRAFRHGEKALLKVHGTTKHEPTFKILWAPPSNPSSSSSSGSSDMNVAMVSLKAHISRIIKYGLFFMSSQSLPDDVTTKQYAEMFTRVSANANNVMSATRGPASATMVVGSEVSTDSRVVSTVIPADILPYYVSDSDEEQEDEDEDEEEEYQGAMGAGGPGGPRGPGGPGGPGGQRGADGQRPSHSAVSSGSFVGGASGD